MLKKIFTLLLISLLTANVTARAQKQDQIEEVRKPLRNDQYGLFNHLGLGIDLISPDGFGINVGTCITPWLQVRAGYSIVPWSITQLPLDIQGVGTKGQPISATIKLGSKNVTLSAGAFMTRHTGNLMFDFFPSRKSSFHFTVGMLAGNDNLVTLKNISSLSEFEGVGVRFYPGGVRNDKNMHQVLVTNGNLELTIGRSWLVRPYVGLGWGSFIPSKRVGVLFDMGVEFNGGMGVIVNARDLQHLGANDKPVRGKIDGAGLQTLIEDMSDKPADENMRKAMDIYQKVSTIPVAGYIKLALVVKLF